MSLLPACHENVVVFGGCAKKVQRVQKSAKKCKECTVGSGRVERINSQECELSHSGATTDPLPPSQPPPPFLSQTIKTPFSTSFSLSTSFSTSFLPRYPRGQRGHPEQLQPVPHQDDQMGGDHHWPEVEVRLRVQLHRAGERLHPVPRVLQGRVRERDRFI